jgi:hypothetical protein
MHLAFGAALFNALLAPNQRLEPDQSQADASPHIAQDSL